MNGEDVKKIIIVGFRIACLALKVPEEKQRQVQHPFFGSTIVLV
jgi:hypothetical protein